MLTILVEYLVAARKTGPGGAGAGQPPCMTGGSGRRGRHVGVWAQRPHPAAGGLASAAGRMWLAWPGWQAWAHAAAAGRLAGAGERGRGRQAALLRCLENGNCSARGPRRRLYPALPRHGSGRGTAAPRSVARQSLATSAVSASGRRHVSSLPRHHT